MKVIAKKRMSYGKYFSKNALRKSKSEARPLTRLQFKALQAYQATLLPCLSVGQLIPACSNLEDMVVATQQL
jgi:hypothetical protein